MNMNFLGAAAVATAMLVAAPAVAATVVFDEFNAPDQFVEDLPNPGNSNSDSVAFGAGTRTLQVMATQFNTTPLGDASLEIGGGELAFSTAAGVTAMAKVIYTNVGDISTGANPYFFFDIGDFDNVSLFTVRAVDTNGNASVYSELLAPGFSPFLFFSQFAIDMVTVGTGGLADFNTLAKLTFKINTTDLATNVDGTLKGIHLNAVPLPAAGFLLFGALGGMAALRRRKSRKAA